MYYDKKRTFKVENESLIFNPHSVMEFIYKFYNEFEYEITGVDASSGDRKFKFQFLYYKNNLQKNVTIEYSDYDAELSYYLHISNTDKLNFKKIFDKEVKFIEKFL